MGMNKWGATLLAIACLLCLTLPAGAEQPTPSDAKGYNYMRMVSGSSRDENHDGTELVDVDFLDAGISILLPLDWAEYDYTGYFGIVNPANRSQQIATTFTQITPAVTARLAELAETSTLTKKAQITIYDFVDPIDEARYAIVVADEPQDNDIFVIKFYYTTDVAFMQLVDYMIDSIKPQNG